MFQAEDQAPTLGFGSLADRLAINNHVLPYSYFQWYQYIHTSDPAWSSSKSLQFCVPCICSILEPISNNGWRLCYLATLYVPGSSSCLSRNRLQCHPVHFPDIPCIKANKLTYPGPHIDDSAQDLNTAWRARCVLVRTSDSSCLQSSLAGNHATGTTSEW